ncbi:DNA-binding response regulator [Streptacidiphilus pinicola]|uniref:DNA-binding response regulator n=1 Tax=Streptacidiphilus pinicola TaxID=2219663 RepID=A0A2X0IMN5_9ACTN|nr:response regulator transcription factor [Streptacidiphilus pinicola]RAG86422.1 DNA-binding response regulator [Streptacidiphilus pinicola]
MTVRVLLVDDQALLRTTFRVVIDSAEDLEVVGEAADGAQAVALAVQHRPDVVLMDIRMPGMDGLAATAAICDRPELAGTHVLILTTFETDEHVATALRAGAAGFLGKDVQADQLLDAIRTVAEGEALLSPTATRSLITRFLATPQALEAASGPDPLGDLTAREREIMSLVAEGMTNQQIAAKLHVSHLTVRTHVHHAMQKLDARDRAQLVVIAYQTGLVQPGAPSD